MTEYVDLPGETLNAVYQFASPASPADFARIPIPLLKVGALYAQNAMGLAKAMEACLMLILTIVSTNIGSPPKALPLLSV